MFAKTMKNGLNQYPNISSKFMNNDGCTFSIPVTIEEKRQKNNGFTYKMCP